MWLSRLDRNLVQRKTDKLNRCSDMIHFFFDLLYRGNDKISKLSNNDHCGNTKKKKNVESDVVDYK